MMMIDDDHDDHDHDHDDGLLHGVLNLSMESK